MIKQITTIIKLKLHVLRRVLLAFGCLSLGSCAIGSIKSVSDVPKAFDLAVENASTADYPQLYQVPQTPLKTRPSTEWELQGQTLDAEGEKVASAKMAVPLDPETAKSDWAKRASEQLAANPKSAPIDPQEDPVIWAARMREQLQKAPTHN